MKILSVLGWASLASVTTVLACGGGDDGGSNATGDVGQSGASGASGGTATGKGGGGAGGKAGSSAGGKSGASAGGAAGKAGGAGASGAGVGGGTAGTGAGGKAGSGTAGTGVGGKAGSGTAGTGTAGSGTAGTGTAGSGTAGSGTAGSGTAGSGTAGSGTAGSGTAGSGTAGSGGGSTCTPVDGVGLFEAPNPWTKDVSCEAPAAESKTIIGALVAAGGWGTGATTFMMDFSIEVMQSDGNTAPFKPAAGYYTGDCENVTSVLLPKVGAIEGQTAGANGYKCDVANDDCHLLVVDKGSKKLLEVYNTTTSGGNVTALCAINWDLTKAYPANLRGDGCTSADAGGFPITAMLANADEVAAGEIPHALRFILPNSRIRKHVYVHPGTHTTAPTSGGPDMPPYGVRFRLRADYPLASLPSDGARTIAKALQRFGMYLADGGNVPLTLQSDQFTTHKWSQLNVDSHSLYGISAADFEVVEYSTPVGAPSGPIADCVPN
jgi:serine/threonine-protein kinase